MTLACVRFLVGGRVQGVSYRAATRAQALALGLTGHARNLDDGRVEVVACGEVHAVAALERWLWQGPPAARVDEVLRGDWPAAEARGFETY
jgi:acylphosphatase